MSKLAIGQLVKVDMATESWQEPHHGQIGEIVSVHDDLAFVYGVPMYGVRFADGETQGYFEMRLIPCENGGAK